MKYFAGIDIGSTAIKVALVDENKQLVGHKISASGSMFYKYAKQSLKEMLGELGIDEKDVVYTVSTILFQRGMEENYLKRQMKI